MTLWKGGDQLHWNDIYCALDDMALDSCGRKKRPFSFSLSHKAQFFFYAGFRCGAFCPVSFLMGITHEALSFWAPLWSVTQLAKRLSDRMYKRTGWRDGQCRSSLVLSIFLSFCSFVATPRSSCSLIFHLHPSACLLYVLFLMTTSVCLHSL